MHNDDGGYKYVLHLQVSLSQDETDDISKKNIVCIILDKGGPFIILGSK